jgi:Bifunctional DNA primase/polymerase, N-terminal/Primase C terminal 1 (PriCT-1)
LDVDGEIGLESFHRLQGRRLFPRTLKALTGRASADGKRCGFHLYFRHPVGPSVHNSKNRLGNGLDVRGAGGYVVAPPSRHQSGFLYEWADLESEIAEVPAWLPLEAAHTPHLVEPEQGYFYEGQRNDKLFRLACRWRRLEWKQARIEYELLATNIRTCRPPLDRQEVLRIAASVARYPAGGPDPLGAAWQKVRAEEHFSRFSRFQALIRHLHVDRPGSAILLPVERIADLLGCDRTLISRYRARAIKAGWIEEAEPYIARKKATSFRVIGLPEESH